MKAIIGKTIASTKIDSLFDLLTGVVVIAISASQYSPENVEFVYVGQTHFGTLNSASQRPEFKQ